MDSLQNLWGAAGGLTVVLLYGAYLLRLSVQQKNNKPKPPVVDCPDCKGKVSTKVAACPHCGRPMG